MKKLHLRQNEYKRLIEMQGYLSVLAALVFPLILALCLVLIEGCRQNTLKLEAECVVDIGLNSVLAEYHREMQEQYDLFFIDTSYGTWQASYERTEERLRTYIAKNICPEDVFAGAVLDGLQKKIYLDLLQLEAESVEITGISLATDNQGYNLQKQAIQAAETNMGITAVDAVLDWVRVVEENDLTTNQVERELQELEERLDQMSKKDELKESEWIDRLTENPGYEMWEARKKGMLSWVMQLITGCSDKSIGTERYISERKAAGEINKGTISGKKEISLYEKLLFQHYLFQYLGDHSDVKEDACLDYQIEYLLFGESADSTNLMKTAASICGMRETANLLYLLRSSEKRAQVNTMASVLSTILLVPEAEPVFEGLLIILWTCAESILDTGSLLKGGRVPLLKNDDSWKSDLKNLFQFGEESEEDREMGLNYEDYLRIFLYMSDLETITYRLMDIMEMDIRKTAGNQYFRMDACVDYLECCVVMEGAAGFTYELTHGKGYR